MKTEYLSSAQLNRLDCSVRIVKPEDANIRFMAGGKLVFGYVKPHKLQAALFRQRQTETSQAHAGGNA